MIKVSDIRLNNLQITKKPIIYFWWFKTSCFQELFRLIKTEIQIEKIKIKEISGENYGLLYIGKAINGNDRLIKYHILDSQNFHIKGVLNGRLSSLRQTICGLLELQMSTSRDQINNFIDQNCIVEFESCSIKELDLHESDKIKKNYLPLNYKHTKETLTPLHRKILSASKKVMKN